MLCIIRFARLSGYSIHLLIQNWLSKIYRKTEVASSEARKKIDMH
jgi:hypothetical protein